MESWGLNLEFQTCQTSTLQSMTHPTPSSGDFVWIAKEIVVISTLNKSKESAVSLIDVVLRAQVWRSPGRVRQEVRIWSQFTSYATIGKTLVFSGLLPEIEIHPFPGSPLSGIFASALLDVYHLLLLTGTSQPIPRVDPAGL